MVSNSLSENYQRYQQRLEFFKTFGHDIACERDMILEQSQPVKGSILEIGTGKGYFAVALAQKGYRLTSVDVSEEEQKYARMNAEYLGLQDRIDFQISDAGRLAFEDHSFDVIFSVNVFHHLDNPRAVIDEMTRVLKKGGKIIISDFSPKGMDLVAKIHQSEGRIHPRGKVVVNHIAHYLERKNFKIQKHRTIFQETLVAFSAQGEEA